VALKLVPREGPAASALAAAAPWLEAWRSTAALGWDYFERMSALADPRRVRSWWLADLRNLTSDALRSPAFLSLMTTMTTLNTLKTFR
jgi:hypothetical protein